MVNQVAVIPPPIGGKNTRDPLHLMNASDAVQLENIFPGDSAAEVRGGHSESASLSGVGSYVSDAIDTLFVLKSGVTEHALAASSGGLYSWHSTPAEVVAASTYTNDRWSWTTFSDSAAPTVIEILAVNGDDAAWKYSTASGHSAWTFSEEGGASLTTSGFKGVQTFKNRVFMWQSDSRDFWFGELGKRPGDAAGTDRLTRFPLSGIRGAQGNLIAMEGWSLDSGDGKDDYAVFFTDNGDVIIYQGTDPSDATKWDLVGVYKTPPLVDERCVEKVLNDVWMVTEEDLYPLSQVIQSQGIAGAQSKLVDDIKSYVDAFGAQTGWEVSLWPNGSKAYINIPTSPTQSRQLVINTRTMAYCDYTGLEARCWATFGGRIYFGSPDGIIYRAETGANDNSAGISWLWQSPYSSFGQGKRKQMQGARPFLEVSQNIDYGLSVSENFDYDPPSCPATVGIVDGWEWDNNSLFAFATTDVNTTTERITITAHGQSDATKVRFYGSDVPSPLAADTVYFVVNSTTDNFQVESTIGGGAINLSDVGSGTHTARFGEPGTEWADLKWTNIFNINQQADYDSLAGNGEMLSLSMCAQTQDIAVKLRAIDVSWQQGTEW